MVIMAVGLDTDVLAVAWDTTITILVLMLIAVTFSITLTTVDIIVHLVQELVPLSYMWHILRGFGFHATETSHKRCACGSNLTKIKLTIKMVTGLQDAFCATSWSLLTQKF